MSTTTPFQAVIRDALSCAEGIESMARDTLADDMYSFLAARSPQSVVNPGVDLSGFAMILLALSGPECSHHRAEVLFAALDTDMDGVVSRRDVEAFLRGFGPAAVSYVGTLMARIDLVLGQKGDRCDRGIDMPKVNFDQFQLNIGRL